MKTARYLLFAFLILMGATLISCRKEIKKFDVVYEVNMPKGNAVSIDYNSDYYAATGIRKEIVYNSDSSNQYYSTVWYARRYAFENENFYLNVKYTNLQHKDSTYKIAVYVNDDLKEEKSGIANMVIEGEL